MHNLHNNYKTKHFCGLFPHFLTFWVQQHDLETSDNDSLHFFEFEELKPAEFYCHNIEDFNIVNRSVFVIAFSDAFVKLHPKNIAADVWKCGWEESWGDRVWRNNDFIKMVAPSVTNQVCMKAWRHRWALMMSPHDERQRVKQGGG